jgi:hypothetical protein
MILSNWNCHYESPPYNEYIYPNKNFIIIIKKQHRKKKRMIIKMIN